ncbi:FAD-dependent oxidoreductase [Kribbella sp. CA-293567]|uniref:FAD-dependent oxidoreductase n=1 Tax=Kribbella sp. CA-293567 TaxID=3002436 RepID=UPI0022DE1DC9|nr:FAD-dependent oxidoreductase [Kribbella sp. CA-293567]WBQ06008.1 2Fe-2S iron-sulfur cluster-binding protein [Kribbella sp. CA-293567]
MSPYLRPAEGDPAEVRASEPIVVTVDGRPLKALPGQTVAAALMADGRDSWRTTRNGGRGRGVFCGIGACFDCLVVVNGSPDVRACQRVVRAGDEVRTQRGTELPGISGAVGMDREMATGGEVGARGVQVAAVVVVGAGPAGMSAAVAAADAGSSVLLIDAGAGAGGQFNRQLPAEFRAGRPEKLQHGWTAFARLRDRIAGDPEITQLTETSVWAVERGVRRTRLWLQRGAADSAGREVWAVETSALVLATGAYDRVLPFPGWELPGVYTAGAAQALAKGQRIAVGRRVVVAGTGPFLLPVAESLVGVGAEVVALLEANHPMTVAKGWLSDPLAAATKVSEGAGYAALLARHRIPLFHGRTVIAAHGEDRVEAVTTARLDRDWNPIPGTEKRLEVDAVCLGFGFTPNLELAVSTRCQLTEAPDGGRAVLVDENQQTTSPGVWAAGELTGIGGAALAAAEGRVAGAAAAVAASSPPAASSADRRAVAQGKRFAAALAAAYPVRDGWLKWSAEDTLVCRCEEVSRGDVDEAVRAREVGGARSLKLSSRVGLGLCQGRVCGRNVAAISGVREEYGRPVTQPVRMSDLAGAEILEDL